MSRAHTLRTLGLALAAGAVVACGGSPGPTAPSPANTVAPSAPVPSPGVPPTSVTFTVRSGAEGLPVVPGATVRVGDVSRTTSTTGTASIAELSAPAVYTVDAPGFLSYRGTVTAPAEVVTLWPWQPGMTDWWIFMTSYYGPDYNKALWRPDRDVVLGLEGVLADEPYQPVWAAAVREVAGALESSGRDAPTVRLAAGPGSVPVRLQEASACEPARWELTPPILTPPPVLTISSATRARDPEAVLGMVTQLMGFLLHLSRQHGPPHSGGTLSPIERTALRMRMLRPPGTTLAGWSLEDSTAAVAEGTSGYWCR